MATDVKFESGIADKAWFDRFVLGIPKRCIAAHFFGIVSKVKLQRVLVGTKHCVSGRQTQEQCPQSIILTQLFFLYAR